MEKTLGTFIKIKNAILNFIKKEVVLSIAIIAAIITCFFVPPDARWSVIAKNAHTPKIGTILDKAMNAIEADNRSLKGVLPKNYANPELNKRVLGNVVDVFTNMDMSDTEASKDLLGRTYEYCIAQFASYEGVKGGEFYIRMHLLNTFTNIARAKEFNLKFFYA